MNLLSRIAGVSRERATIMRWLAGRFLAGSSDSSVRALGVYAGIAKGYANKCGAKAMPQPSNAAEPLWGSLLSYGRLSIGQLRGLPTRLQAASLPQVTPTFPIARRPLVATGGFRVG